MGLPANPWDCCQPLGYSKAKFQCGLLCQNHMMSVLFSPDQNNQSFRLAWMVISKWGRHFYCWRSHTNRGASPSHPGPGASWRRATNPSVSVPAPHILRRVLHTAVHSMTGNYSGSLDKVCLEHKANTFINNQLHRKTTENGPWLSHIWHYLKSKRPAAHMLRDVVSVFHVCPHSLQSSKTFINVYIYLEMFQLLQDLQGYMHSRGGYPYRSVRESISLPKTQGREFKLWSTF